MIADIVYRFEYFIPYMLMSIYFNIFIDSASHPEWGVRFCRHFTLSHECVESKFQQFPFYNYHHFCLTYSKINPPRTGHVTTQMTIFINGISVKQGNDLYLSILFHMVSHTIAFMKS